MSSTRPPKKSENLEIRIPHETKRAFMARCQAQGRSASDVMRGFIDRHLAEGAARRRVLPRLARPAAAAASLAGIATLFMVAPAVSAADREASFRALDRNGDGVVTRVEFVRPEGAGGH